MIRRLAMTVSDFGAPIGGSISISSHGVVPPESNATETQNRAPKNGTDGVPDRRRSRQTLLTYVSDEFSICIYVVML